MKEPYQALVLVPVNIPKSVIEGDPDASEELELYVREAAVDSLWQLIGQFREVNL